MKKNIIVFLICLSFIALSSFSALSQEPIVIHFGGGQPAGVDWNKPTTVAGLVFKNFVEDRSGGRVKVEFYPGHQLGANRERLEAAMMGSLEMTTCPEGEVSTVYPPIMVVSIPFLFSSEVVAWDFFDNSLIWQNMLEEFREETGLRSLAWPHHGFRHLSTRGKLVKEPHDLDGMKIRVMESPVFEKLFSSLGALPTAMAGSEIYTALQQGTVDGYDQPTYNVVGFKFYEVAKNLTLTGHVFSVFNLFINENFYQSLPDDIKGIIREGAKLFDIVTRGVSVASEYEVSLSQLREQGMEIYTPTPEQREEFRKIAQPPVIDWMKTQIDEKYINEVLKEVSKIEEKY